MSPCIINHYVLIINHYVGARRWWPRSASRAAHLLAKKPSRRQWILLQQLRRTMLRRMQMTRTHSVLPKACSTTAQSKSRAARTAQWAWSLRAPSSTGTEVASHLCPQLGRGTHLRKVPQSPHPAPHATHTRSRAGRISSSLLHAALL